MLNANVRNNLDDAISAFGDEDAGVSAGVPGVRERVSGGIATLNHRLPAGKPPVSPNRRLRRGKETPEAAESECEFVPQDTDGEVVMARDCPEIWRGKAESGKRRAQRRSRIV
jgi:hypothetical protein